MTSTVSKLGAGSSPGSRPAPGTRRALAARERDLRLGRAIAADRYSVSGAQILLETGRRKLIGGQEDQLIDIALMLQAEAGQR